MIQIVDNTIKWEYDACQQCGACLAVCPVNALSKRPLNNGLIEIAVNSDMCIFCKKCFKVCPANKKNDYNKYFDDFPDKLYYLGYNKDNDIRSASSSGGVAKTLIIESLKNRVVDGVYSLKSLPKYPSAVGEFYTLDNLPAYDEIPNSVYHSVLQCLELHKVRKCKTLMIVGTACQLRALGEALNGKFERIIKVCIFCKQQKTLDSTRFLAKICKTKIHKDLNFTVSYRGNGWPGQVTVKDKSVPWYRASQIPFGMRVWTVPGCNVCGDSYGILAGADLTLMDPWVIRPHNALGETVITVHSATGRELLSKTIALQLDEISYQDVQVALSISDVKRKQLLEPYFRGQKCAFKVRLAGRLEKMRRGFVRNTVTLLPRMPLLFYRILCKLPDLQKKILS